MTNFDEFCNQHQLTAKMQNEDNLHQLESWCREHVSQDYIYQGNPEDIYEKYFQLAKKHQHFLSQINQDFIHPALYFEGMNAIQYAAYQGFDRFISSLSLQADVFNQSTSSGMTPLHLSAVQGFIHTVEALIKKGANPEVRNKNNQLPLHSACFIPNNNDSSLISKKISIVRALLDKAPTTLVEKDNNGETVFHLLTKKNAFLPLLDDLLDKNSKGALFCNNRGKYPIHLAVLSGEIEIAERLLKMNKVALLTDSDQRVPLHDAARYGNPRMLTLCCTTTNDLNLFDNEGQTPLLNAVESGTLDNVKILVEHGADLTLSDPFKNSVLHYAARTGDASLLKWVLDQKQVTKEFINQHNVEGRSPLQLCQQYHHNDLSELLRAHGAVSSNSPKNGR